MSTSTFIDQLYNKFLFRTADTSGKDYWTTQIENGMTATDVAKSFIDSTEYQSAVASLSKLYFLVFNRLPDFDGLQYWVNEGQAGSTVAQIANSFVVSNEFQTAYGAAVTNEGFMDLLYQNAFSRAADADGKAYWVAEMEKGMNRADVVASFAVSDEFHTVAGSKVQTTSIYYGLLDRIPTTDELSAAPADTSELITTLFASSDYKGETITQTISGKVIDGYITGATVFMDKDGDGVLDANEVSTTTDNDGDFTLSGEGSLVATGGTDISTGLAFDGVLKAPSGSTVINPVTTLIHAVVAKGQSAAAATQTVSKALGLSDTVDLTTFDPIAEATKTNTDNQALQIALDIQSANLKVANMMAQASAVMQGAAGDQLGKEAAMLATVEALADKIETVANSTDSIVDLADQTLLEETMNLAVTKALDSITDTTVASELAGKVANLADEAATMLADANKGITQALTSADPANVLGALENAVKIQTVAQGNATNAILEAAKQGSLDDIVNTYTGTALDDLSNQVVVNSDALTGGDNFQLPDIPTTDPTLPGDTTDNGNGTGNDLPAGNTGGSGTVSPPAISISYSTDTFVEASANNGTVSTVSTLTISGNETFTGSNGQTLAGAVVTNVPAGLTAVVTKTSDTTATLTLTGNASSHTNGDDINNLTVTLGNAAFTGGNASAVSGATKNNLSVNFADPDAVEVNYSPTTFAEATANDGSITATSTVTLTGDTFAGANGQVISDVTFSNVPAGLNPSLVKSSDTTATLSFTGSAAAHAATNSVANITVSFPDAAFVNSDASAVTGAVNSTLAINFDDPVVKSLSYSTTTFAEAAANDGSITATSTLTLANETFAGANGAAVAGATFSNVPAGLTASLVKASDTTATLSFTGSAGAHANSNDVSNFTVTLGDTAFVGGDASSVTGASKNDLVINFADPITKSLAYSATTFAEASANDGSVTATSTLTLTNETFTGANGQAISGATFANVPAGLTASLVKASDTTATLSFTGTAAAHANSNDVNDFTVTLGDTAFAGGSASSVTGASKNDLVINFADPVTKSLAYSATTLAEASANDGSITATSTLTLTNETFTGANGQAIAGATFTNVPAGLSASLVKASDTTATLSFTGSAAAHANSNDVSNFTVTLGDTAFAGGSASAVTGATTNNLVIDFADPRTLSYNREHFTEAVANDGSITVSATLTLSGDTFTGSNGSALPGASFANVPGGLTASLVKATDTTATLTFTGNASAHANANDLSNVSVTLANAAFSGGNASSVTGATNSITIDYADLGAIISGDSSNNILLGTGSDDIIYGAGGADIINAAAGIDTIDITDASTASASIAVTETTNGLDTVIGFDGGVTANGGDVLNFSSITSLTDSVATALSLSSDFSDNNVFIFDTTAISIDQAASAIAADASVTATKGIVVIADSTNSGAVTAYYSDNLANDGTETALVTLTGINISDLTADNIQV